jgi:hypothetical protein
MSVNAQHTPVQRRRYLRPPEALYFPVEDAEPVGESPRHFELRTALWQALRLGFGNRAAVRSEQFVYYNGRDPGACCAPDVFVYLGGDKDPCAGAWRTWELGTPELAFEIVSASDARDRPWDEKLARYRELGVHELVRFDPDATQPLRIWDRVDEDLVERDASDPESSRCDTLDAFYCVREHPTYGPWLFLARDREGRDPYLSSEEALEVEADARRRAEERVRELEAELERRRGRR